MKIAVISDLHLGRGDRFDEFGHDDAEFLRFLDFLERNHERVVLAGDIWETLQGATPRRQARELAKARRAHAEIAQRFERPAYRYLHGNHDLVAGNVIEAPDVLHIEADGTRLLFTHGHQFDFVVKHARWFSELVAWLGGWALRLGLRPLYRTVEWIEGRIRGESRASPDKDRFQLASMALAARHEADVIVTGHTHNGMVTEHGERLFMNSGSCAGGRCSFLSLDTARGDYALSTSW
ncbi:MAG: serine/threonine protein phosphatase [Proteobacteria bacterium]|nr:MAG: serine/threonine protein phosphatase [Pseudomonadota bacterium]